LDDSEGDETISENRWFAYEGGTGKLWFWLISTFFLLLIVIPSIIIFNVFITPVYMYALIVSKTGINFNQPINRRRFWIISVMVLFFILLYSTIPIIFFIVTVP
jgi:hypothetical protein